MKMHVNASHLGTVGMLPTGTGRIKGAENKAVARADVEEMTVKNGERGNAMAEFHAEKGGADGTD